MENHDGWTARLFNDLPLIYHENCFVLSNNNNKSLLLEIYTDVTNFNH